MQLTKPIKLSKPSFGSLPSLGSVGRKKAAGLAGLNIEAGSIAVAEVSSNGTSHLAGSAIHDLYSR